MATSPPVIPTGPPPHPAMDYAALRSEAVALLGRLSGSQWTDHNIHDPGITILEQLCFAITDLAYRTDFPIADLTAIGGMEAWPPPAAQLLSGDPVTQEDLRALLQTMGATALRIIPRETTALPLYFHERDGSSGRGDLLGEPPPWDPLGQPIRLRGLRQVRLQPAALIPAVTGRLHRSRLLAEDVLVEDLTPFFVAVHADLEVGAVDDPAGLLAEILRILQAAITPEPEAPPAEGIRSSDLLHALLDLPQVRAVRSIGLASPSAPENLEPWLLPVPADSTAVIDPTSPIRLFRDGLPLPVDQSAVARRSPPQPAALQASPSTPEVPGGRRRDLSRFASLRRQLPAAYGVGPDGLGSAASPERRAIARQLEAYLLIFDQLLSNALAQLALAPELLSPVASPGGAERSYGSRPVDDPPLRTDHLIDPPAGGYAAWLQEAVEAGDPRERRQGFLAHLLARFGEELTPPGADLLALRREFLADIARMGGARGSGADLLEPAAGPGGFEERLRRRLALPRFFPAGSKDPPFLLIEHLLLRPLPEDRDQLRDDGDGPIPFLASVAAPDPWSLQVSLVMNHDLMPSGSDAADTFERRVAQALCSELPAHLQPRLLWFGNGGGPQQEPELWTTTLAAWRTFRDLLADYRKALDSPQGIGPALQLACRDARDRVIELLQLGLPWPLRDIPLPAELVVTQGRSAAVTLGFSQIGVRYQLWDRDTEAPLQPPVTADGTGKPLELATPPILSDRTFRVRAVKANAVPPVGERATWLRGEIRVIEGINTSLVPAFRDLPRVAPAAPAAFTACLCDHGVTVQVDIPSSQNGITYDLVDRVDLAAGVDQQQSRSAGVSGNGGTITLSYPFAAEDRDLQVRARRTVPTGSGIQVALLSTILPLRVRADRAVPLAVVAPVLNPGESATLQVGNALTKAQQAVTYQLWSRRIADEEFITDPFQPPPSAPQPRLEVNADGRTVRVAPPPPTADPEALTTLGFTPLTPPQLGNANVLSFDLGPSSGDTTWLALASKTHRLDPLDGLTPSFGTSTVQLAQAGVLLVRPDPGVRLTLVRWQQDATSGLWQLQGGEPGVVYLVSRDGSPLGAEAYVHQADALDPAVARGLERLRVEVDLAIAADPLPSAPRTKGLPPPLLELALAADALTEPVKVRARRAMTGLQSDMSEPPLLVRFEPAVVPEGSQARIVLLGRAGDTYGLELDRTPMGASQAGDGSELTFATDPLSSTTAFTLVIRSPAGDERRLPVTVRVEERR
ncbi:hypothetical protein NZK33_03960 [Cyanobium sp. FGCU-6]|nr:hypothetical protein [Cyanobium sp. FGCU6]